MRNRFMTVLFAGLLILVATLFVLACGLSRKQYLSGIQSIKADGAEILANEGRNIRERTRAVERDAFALFDQTNMPGAWYAANRLFRLEGNEFVPVGLPRPAGEGASTHGVAWQTAAELSQLSTNQRAPFRMPYNDQILSVNAKGQACLLPLKAFCGDETSNAITRITLTAPGARAAMSRQLRYPPVHVWIPAELFELRMRAAEQAYVLTNVMLGVLLSVMIGVGVAVGMLVKRQHEMARLKSAFVSSVSHELRTPMALIRLYAESLAAENPPPGTRERYTRAIMGETDRLIALVNNVLDFSRLEKEFWTMNLRSTDVSKLCGDVLDSFRVRVEQEGMTLTRKIPAGVTAWVDPAAMTQVIFNVVDNAVKYSGGKKTVDVELTREGGEVCLRVKDEGIGIPDGLKPRVLMPFVRGEDSRVTAQRGSGIGLSVVAQFLERMGGSIRFLDNAGGGTVVEIRVPAGEGGGAGEARP